MKTPKTIPSASRADEVRRLVERAAKQPGVNELYMVYQAWRSYDWAFDAHNRLQATKQIVSISSSSGQVLRLMA